jgi:hypothetical protein
MMKTKERKYLDRVATNIVLHVVKLSDEDLNALSGEVNGLNQTNCWWVTYRLCAVIKEIIENERDYREQKASAAIAAAEGGQG